jgi:hypothetical protein
MINNFVLYQNIFCYKKLLYKTTYYWQEKTVDQYIQINELHVQEMLPHLHEGKNVCFETMTDKIYNNLCIALFKYIKETVRLGPNLVSGS